eukprot:gnl/MRDRNA2_/MRDRNA2_32416_c0_seq2.p1 gnl/MRDRNA2_/MRDRNA2_32416_c0~~gnl/MRDRNA2_/MRDRNA2_32416_c0_seq2.p1  ORF type:complete len:233 (-),score=50.33 gnl/MRDRNA2_/MRDRNA2_32416_c0_seq2:47-745(-)
MKGRLYRCSCRPVLVPGRGTQYLKDLTAITQKLNNVVLVDNNPISFVCQPCNGIPIPDFVGEPDNELDQVLSLLRQLQNVPDVRPRLRDMFQLETQLASLQNQLVKNETAQLAARQAARERLGTIAVRRKSAAMAAAEEAQFLAGQATITKAVATAAVAVTAATAASPEFAQTLTTDATQMATLAAIASLAAFVVETAAKSAASLEEKSQQAAVAAKRAFQASEPPLPESTD